LMKDMTAMFSAIFQIKEHNVKALLHVRYSSVIWSDN